MSDAAITYAEMRAAVGQLLRLAEREHRLARAAAGHGAMPFGDSRRIETLASALATVCVNSTEGRQLLEASIARKAREVALLEEKEKRNERTPTIGS